MMNSSEDQCDLAGCISFNFKFHLALLVVVSCNETLINDVRAW
jgi:hypothetical protein